MICADCARAAEPTERARTARIPTADTSFCQSSFKWRYDPLDTDHLPIACTLTEDGLRARKAGLLADVMGLARSTVPLETGFRLEFRADDLPHVTAMIDAERQCCRFLRFVLTVEPDLGAVALELTGPPGTREFLDTLLAPA